jgi:hypothetical protein
MDKVEFTVAEAAVLYGFSRQKLYNSIKNGDLSKNRKSKLDLSELIRCYGEPKGGVVSKGMSKQGVQNLDNNLTPVDMRELESLRQQIRESKEREQFYQDQIRSLTDSVKLLEHKKSAEPERRRGLLGILFN